MTRQDLLSFARDTLVGAGLLACVAAGTASAQESDTEQFAGRVEIGYRAVDVGGEEGKYRQHIGLDDGPRLFGLGFAFRPSGDLQERVDRIDFNLDSVGGEPFESFRFNARKAGAYEFRYDRRKSDYFYEDIILPTALADHSLDNEGDISSFDFERIRDAASVKVMLTPDANINVGFDRYTKQGVRTLPIDIQRDVFEFEQPISERLEDFSVGFDYTWPKATLYLEEQFQRFESDGEIFTPGANPGLNPDNASSLDFFFLNQPYEFDSFRQTVGVNSRPTTNLTVQASVIFETLDLNGTASERSRGTGFNGAPFSTDVTGVRQISRDFSLIDAGVSYTVRPNVVLSGTIRRNDLDQEGEFTFGVDSGQGLWNTGTTGVEGGVLVGITPQVTVNGGLRYETRDVDYDQTEGVPMLQSHTTDHVGVFAGMSWRPTRMVKVHAEIETGTFDDPFTLASPTDRVRLKVGGDLSHTSGAFGSVTYLAHRLSNDNSLWESDSNQLNLRGGYRAAGVVASVGYALVDVRREVDQLVNPGSNPFVFPVLFMADTNFVDGRLHWQAHERVTIGTDLRYYTTDGSFAVDRRDHRVFGEVGVGRGYTAGVSYRSIAYEETALGFNDYDANIVEFSLGYRF